MSPGAEESEYKQAGIMGKKKASKSESSSSSSSSDSSASSRSQSPKRDSGKGEEVSGKGDDGGDRDRRVDEEGGEGGEDGAAGGGPRGPSQLERSKMLPVGKAGGAYIPPFRLKQMQEEMASKASPEYQRMTWEALKKGINGNVNKVTKTNMTTIIQDLLKENLVRGRGLYCRSVMKAVLASPGFANVYAALTAVINTKLPENGETLLKRVIMQFRRSYKRNDKPVCVAMVKFIAHLINQQVAHEILGLQVAIPPFPTSHPTPPPKQCTAGAMCLQVGWG